MARRGETDAYDMAGQSVESTTILLENLKRGQRIVERQFMQGISQYADKTGKGEESLAEAFVCYRNKEKIPIRAELLIRSYIERWKK